MTAHLDSGPTPPPRSDVPRIGAAEPATHGGPTSYDQLDDHELLRLHVAGNPDSFGFLVKRHRDRMWAVAIRTLGEPEEAADALQEAFISAFRRADSFRGDAKVTTWLHRIVVNACIDRVRRRQARPTVPLAETDPPERPVDSDTALDVRAALATLPIEQRMALVLVDMQGYSVADAAALLDVAEGTIKSRCARGRARLALLLGYLRNPDGPGGVPLGDGERGGRR